LKIVHVGKFYSPCPGGIETHLQGLAEGQAARGHDVSVVCMAHTGSAGREARAGVTVHRLARRLSVAKLDWVSNLVTTLKRLEADVLHVHVPNPTMILGLLRANPSTPIVVTYHSDNVAQRLRSAVFQLAERPFYRRVQRLLATSEAYAEGSRTLRRHLDKTSVVPLGIDLKLAEPTAAREEEAANLRCRYGTPLWFGCGRLVRYKGFQIAIEALREAPGTLLLAGEGPLRAELEREVERHGLRGRVHLLGHIDDALLRTSLVACDAFWFPSITRNEAFGLAQVEAMAAGKPVINCQIRHSGVPWVSEHMVSGLTVPVGDARAFARAATQLAADAGLRVKLGDGARQRARALFDQERTLEEVLRVYDEMLRR
jgi:glycosyltransferase involved in cell wall biosynthesis